ncbi:MAG: hypothetical protein GY871_11625 [Actinomycetales bacterium]|nr:hypothetical protein [Actinomycetales bacterium]MCP4894749.1 hypothetical protein [Actinomycetales bacterium]
MKKADVKIGGEYYAKVTNKKVVVRIDAENRSGGWDATNLSTNKKIRIKTAQRLQGVARKRSDTTKITTDGNVTVVESPRATTETFTNKRARKRVDKKAAGAKAKNAEAAEKKLSCVAAALKVLGESSEPLNTKEMIEEMVAAGYWESPGGKTPHATLYSAILREMKKGDESRFVKTDRGRFTVRA